jgi:hypothetical protein
MRMRGLLLFGDTVRSAALRHEIPIAIIDPLLFAEVDARQYVLTSHLLPYAWRYGSCCSAM